MIRFRKPEPGLSLLPLSVWWPQLATLLEPTSRCHALTATSKIQSTLWPKTPGPWRRMSYNRLYRCSERSTFAKYSLHRRAVCRQHGLLCRLRTAMHVELTHLNPQSIRVFQVVLWRSVAGQRGMPQGPNGMPITLRGHDLSFHSDLFSGLLFI